MADRDELIDTDGENLAVRWFLAAYGGGVNTIHRMAIHMQQCGFGWTHPDWVIPHTPGETLTKGGAQSWLRHLFSLEADQSGNVEAVAQMSGDCVARKRDLEVAAQMLRGAMTTGREAHELARRLDLAASQPSNAAQRCDDSGLPFQPCTAEDDAALAILAMLCTRMGIDQTLPANERAGKLSEILAAPAAIDVRAVPLHMRPIGQVLSDLWHHQGGSSEVGQPIREILGMGAHQSMTGKQISLACRYEASLPLQSPPQTGKEVNDGL